MIVYTMTDEAPALATYSLLPVIKAFLDSADIQVVLKDISLAGRIVSQFPDYLDEDQRSSDALAELENLVQRSEANIIKLPNISASIPQIKQAVRELQEKGYSIPDFPEKPKTPKEVELRKRYDRIKGSAVNPILREGNSDRRVPRAVKSYARTHPHSMGAWSPDSRSHVSSMNKGDFYESEHSLTMERESVLTITLHEKRGSKRLLRDKLYLQQGEIVDVACMSCRHLRHFLKQEIADARSQGLLFSIHLKATMMKVSDPIIFGHTVSVFFDDLFTNYAADLASVGVNPNNGLADLYAKINALPQSRKDEIIRAIARELEEGPDMAMVNSDQGITNLHVPSDIIIDASMPAAIRSSGRMWGPDGNLRDIKVVIPDRSYAGIYQEAINFCKQNGAFDPTSMGSVSNVGLMAQKAEEYGSHDKTFEIPSDGQVVVSAETGEVLFTLDVEAGDIFRMCQVKDAPIQDWIRLAVERAQTAPAIFWLDKNRAHDQELIKKIELYLPQYNTSNLDITIMSPVEAMAQSLECVKTGNDCIAVTGNVLRDYLTDFFPILELGTSAKMLSTVPLMKGGILFETGAGGSAPKHVQQFLQEGHLRWDSLGEFLALAMSLEHYGRYFDEPRAIVLARALDKATEKILMNNKAPRRKLHELDNRGSHYYLAKYWSDALVAQDSDPELAKFFQPFSNYLEVNEEQILDEFSKAQGEIVDIGGYYFPNPEKVERFMRPSKALNSGLENLLSRKNK